MAEPQSREMEEKDAANVEPRLAQELTPPANGGATPQTAPAHPSPALAPQEDKHAGEQLGPSQTSQSFPRRQRKTLFSRVANLVHLSRSRSNSAASSIDGAGQQSALNGGAVTNGDGADSSTPQRQLTPEEKAARIAENKERKRYIRSLPSWIHSTEEGDLDNGISPASALLPRQPAPAEPARHVFAPENSRDAFHRKDHHAGGADDGVSHMVSEPVSRWLPFIRASAYPKRASQEGGIVDEEWMRENLPNLDEPWEPEPEPEKSKDHRFWLLSTEKRSATGTHIQRILMRNPFIPLIIRITVLSFCLAALGLGATIYHGTSEINRDHRASKSQDAYSNQPIGNYLCKQQTSTYMAFIVDSCAVVYLVYITWDEYFSKPLGLRRSRDKMRLLFLDLLFIVFSAANLGLAFNTLTDEQWACFFGNPSDLNLSNEQAARSLCVHNGDLCARQKALCSVLLFAEIAWIMTFAISTLRVVERVSR